MSAPKGASPGAQPIHETALSDAQHRIDGCWAVIENGLGHGDSEPANYIRELIEGGKWPNTLQAERDGLAGLLADRDRLAAEVVSLRKQVAKMPMCDCGPGHRSDEDGCCVTCGGDLFDEDGNYIHAVSEDSEADVSPALSPSGADS